MAAEEVKEPPLDEKALAAAIATLVVPSYNLWFRREPAKLGWVAWVGGVDTARSDAFLGSRGIMGIVNCAGAYCRGSSPIWGMRRYLEIEALDSPTYDIMQHVPQVVDFCRGVIASRASMHGGGGGHTDPVVLIHCHAGMNRSVAIAIGVAHVLTGMKVEDLLVEVTRHRPVLTNTAFQKQLAAWAAASAAKKK